MNIADILNADNSPETFQPRTRGYATSIPRSTISPTISESIPTNLGYQHSSHRFFQSSPKLSPAVDTQFANPGSLTNSGTGRQHQTILNSDYQGSESYTHPAAYALSVRSYNSVSNTTHAKPQHGKNTYTNGDYRSSQDLDTRQSRDPDQIQRNISLATLASLATSRDSKDPSAAQQPSNQTPVDGSCYSWNSTTAVSRKLTSFSHARGDHESAQLRDYVRNQHESLSPRTRTNDVE